MSLPSDREYTPKEFYHLCFNDSRIGSIIRIVDECSDYYNREFEVKEFSDNDLLKGAKVRILDEGNIWFYSHQYEVVEIKEMAVTIKRGDIIRIIDKNHINYGENLLVKDIAFKNVCNQTSFILDRGGKEILLALNTNQFKVLTQEHKAKVGDKVVVTKKNYRLRNRTFIIMENPYKPETSSPYFGCIYACDPNTNDSIWLRAGDYKTVLPKHGDIIVVTDPASRHNKKEFVVNLSDEDGNVRVDDTFGGGFLLFKYGMYKRVEQKSKAQPCGDCKGKGTIELFTSTVKCEKCKK